MREHLVFSAPVRAFLMAPRPGKSARKICQDAPKYQNRRLDVGTKLVWNRGNVVCARCVARMLLNQARWHLGGGSSSTRTVCNSSASVRLATFFLSFPRPSKYRRFTRRVGLNASEMMDVSAPPLHGDGSIGSRLVLIAEAHRLSSTPKEHPR